MLELTQKQRKKIYKKFNSPEEIFKLLEEIDQDIETHFENQMKIVINEYLDIYSIAVAYTLRYVCGLGKKRLPETMQRIWNNIDSFKTKHLNLEDCIKDLEDNGIKFETIINDQNKIRWGSRE